MLSPKFLKGSVIVDVKMTISVRVEITQEENNVVKMVGQCEGEYRKFTLYCFEQKLSKIATDCEGVSVKDIREVLFTREQFYLAFAFPNESKKEEFLSLLEELEKGSP